MAETAAASPGQRKVFVSYAWGDTSTEVVDKLCQKLTAESWDVVRDNTAMRHGDLISAFMRRISRADKVIVVLSEKYLHSPYCMTELYGIYQGVQGDKTDFLQHVIPLTLDDAKFSSPQERVQITKHWKQQFEALKKDLEHLGVEDVKLFKAIQDWYNHVSDVLAYIADRLHPHGFEQIVKNDFAALLQMLDPTTPQPPSEHPYLKRLIAEIEKKARLFSPLAGVANLRPNLTALDPWKDEPGIELLIKHQSRKRDAEETPDQDRRYDNILAAFGEVKRAVLLGAPGAGKSTTLRKLALDLAYRALADAHVPVPVLVSLGDWTGDEPLSQFLAERAPEVGGKLEALAKAGRLVLLLDGLNEMPTAKRAKKAAEVRALCSKLEKLSSATAIVGSCRREDYVGDLDLGLDTLTLEPLSPQRIRAVLLLWMADKEQQPAEKADRLFWQLAGDERLKGVFQKWLAAGATENTFWTAASPQDEKEVYSQTTGAEDQLWTTHIPNPRSLLKLASNPFMLTMLFQVWVAEGALPKNRGDLFSRFIDRLLHREGLLAKNAETQAWQLTKDGDLLVKGLASLAWQMQRQSAPDDDAGVVTVIPQNDAVRLFASPGLLKKALDATLLEGTDELRFRHQLLQEYFTAKALQNNMDRTPAQELWPASHWWQRTGWEEAAVLLAGFHAADCTKVIRWLAPAQPEVAAQCIVESGADLASRKALLSELQASWLPRLTDIQREPAPEARAALGRALGRLNLDNRKGVGLRSDGLPDIDWVEIPGGDFIYQEEKRPRKIETFQIARYPVTHAQFQAFLEAKDGYADDRWWRGLDNPDRTPEAARWGESNHPRETVSWQEAMAFCAWLGDKLNRDVRLPTEWQWERAARGRDGREFPWGKNYLPGYANINETYQEAGPHSLSRTSAAGIYPQGASVEGVLDLAGNVWEWCLNEYQKPERIQPGGRETRVVRGGSWGYDHDHARAVVRDHILPYNRLDFIGFRVVCGSPMKS